MMPFKAFTGIVVPLDRVNVDTDQIVPKQFLKLVQRTGFGQYLFYDWRFQPDGAPKKEFILNRPEYRKAEILLTRANFGCGSSREHAVWAIQDYGFRVIIAPSYADIFFNNCLKNGVLPVTLPADTVDLLFREVSGTQGYRLKVDLEAQTITRPNQESIRFEIDPFRRKCLLEGLDDIALTLQYEDKIAAYETKLKPYQLVKR